ncbi:MAG TPA: alpha-glucuronidase family glycosyl hydrolase [Haliscomenobacter sp.]|uniref:alpha-glucuronidase family glycosyl hydrolase n=1 Tax=Haliscomenobacter sp. TaxID=2717303 RepID=UPI002BD34320|nr:alpha-glucuronidase family glycosyl hydrolase [Haliscomenobacter sp.]HOY15874.1 alpha-glucuronidase family glycosyl hydrolase [Haliscomenobacter sp.]
MRHKICLFLLLLSSMVAKADDGYRLWLKYDLIKNASVRAQYLPFGQYIAYSSTDPVVQTAARELQTGLQGLLGKSIRLQGTASAVPGGISLELTTTPQPNLGSEGYTITTQNTRVKILANTPSGLLYGTFALLRKIQTATPVSKIPETSVPRVQLRMLNHWDNTNGSIERGYAGASLWKWYELPETIDPRYRDYARANASIGINAVVLNNVNASARFISREYLLKVKAIADVFKPYGIKVYLSVNFAAPRILGKLKNSDPLEPAVRQWWVDKASEIYGIMPDFGGFLVKANSEGEPGPQDFGRTHADGANMLAEALAPFKGIVIWRAFVYKADPKGDRFKAAYEEFKNLDGTFLPNVVVQVKNGPIDFQPREPFSPLFGAMPKTPLAMEFQITQEYLGFSTNLVYLAPLFKECLDSDTYAKGAGSTVAKVIDGSLHQYPISVMAGVANTGSDRNWCGHLMSQSNWYAFGRLAWDHQLSSSAIADEWIKMTLTQDASAVKTILAMMERSREVYVDFTTPLGLHHIMGQGIHFGPEPWLERSARPDWTSIYYHRADSIGLGFDRGVNGSNALSLYHPEAIKQWSQVDACPLPYLLWFHHVPWGKKLSTGRSLWDELCTRYYTGSTAVSTMQQEWAGLKGKMDAEIHADVLGRLGAQQREALWWRDACVLYFQQYSKMSIPAPFTPPSRSLEEIKELVRMYQFR